MMRKPLGYHPPTFWVLRCNAVFYFCTDLQDAVRSSTSARGVLEMPRARNESDPETTRAGPRPPAGRDLKPR